MNYDRENFLSDYLCPHCGWLLYLSQSGQPTDVCINPDCELWPDELFSIVDATESNESQLYEELKQQEERLIAEIS